MKRLLGIWAFVNDQSFFIWAAINGYMSYFWSSDGTKNWTIFFAACTLVYLVIGLKLRRLKIIKENME